MEQKTLPYLLLAVLGIIWGTSFVLIETGLQHLSALQVASIRITIAGGVFFPFMIRHLRRISKKDVPYAILAGFLGSGFPAFLFAAAQTRIHSSTAGVLNATTPVFTTILAVALFKTVIERKKYIGILVGFAGAIVVILETKGYIGEISYPHAAMIILATLFYGTNINLIKTRLSHYRSITISIVPIGMLFIPGLIMIWVSGLPATLTETADLSGVYRSIGAIAILGIIGTAFALILFNRLIQVTNAVFASSVTYIIPVVAMIVGWAVGESIGLLQIAGLALILTGIRLVNRRLKPKSGLSTG